MCRNPRSACKRLPRNLNRSRGVMTTLEILEKLVGFDTTSAQSNLGLIDYIEDFLISRGFVLHRVTAPCGQKAGLFCVYGPPGAGVMLSAHTDVVPVSGQVWTRPAFALTRDAGRLYGRGTTDMKGFLAAMLNAADRATRMDLRAPLKLAISYDEEIGCVGMQHMIDHLAPSIGLPRACIVGEPTSMQVAIGHKGKAAFRATCHGTSGHSALAPQFTNALHIATDFVTALRRLQADIAANGARDEAYLIPYSTVHVGQMQGGEALNIVPGHAELQFEIRYLAADGQGALQDRITAAARDVTAAYQASDPAAGVTVDCENAYPGLDVDPAVDIVTLSQGLAHSNQTTKVAFGTEAGFFDRLGIPTVVCGPGSMEGQGHKADEFIEAADLAACDAMLGRLLDCLCDAV